MQRGSSVAVARPVGVGIVGSGDSDANSLQLNVWVGKWRQLL